MVAVGGACGALTAPSSFSGLPSLERRVKMWEASVVVDMLSGDSQDKRQRQIWQRCGDDGSVVVGV